MTGNFPKNMVDHINGDGCDNNWENLRDATQQKNNRNQIISQLNLSGFTGVCWEKSREKWHVTISINNKSVFGGRFINREDAIKRCKELNLEHNFHENHGRTN